MDLDLDGLDFLFTGIIMAGVALICLLIVLIVAQIVYKNTSIPYKQQKTRLLGRASMVVLVFGLFAAFLMLIIHTPASRHLRKFLDDYALFYPIAVVVLATLYALKGRKRDKVD